MQQKDQVNVLSLYSVHRVWFYRNLPIPGAPLMMGLRPANLWFALAMLSHCHEIVRLPGIISGHIPTTSVPQIQLYEN